MRSRVLILAAILAAVPGVPSPAGAAEIDHSAGRALAEQWCTECHQVLANGKASPNPAAPRFTEIAAAPGASELSLHVLLQSEHVTMPQIRMSAEQMDALVGYIMSLKPPK